MSTQKHPTPEPEPRQAGIPFVPDEIEQEERDERARRASDHGPGGMREESIAALALIDPSQVEARLSAREKALGKLREIAIRKSHPFDWTLYKDREGHVVGVPRDSAAVVIRKWMGISIFNYRPTEHGIPEPRITKEIVQDKDREGAVVGEHEVTIAEMWADGLCALTGEPLESIYFAARSDKPFVGSGTLQDLKAACRTGLDTKVTRILSGLRKVPVDQLQLLGVDTTKSIQGAGYGSSADRAAGRVAEEGVGEKAKALGDEVLRRVAGDVAAAKQLLSEISSWTDKDGKKVKGFDTVAKFTRPFQVENAWKALRVHPTFGDAKSSGNATAGEKKSSGGNAQAEREPGVDDE